MWRMCTSGIMIPYDLMFVLPPNSPGRKILSTRQALKVDLIVSWSSKFTWLPRSTNNKNQHCRTSPQLPISWGLFNMLQHHFLHVKKVCLSRPRQRFKGWDSLTSMCPDGYVWWEQDKVLWCQACVARTSMQKKNIQRNRQMSQSFSKSQLIMGTTSLHPTWLFQHVCSWQKEQNILAPARRTVRGRANVAFSPARSTCLLASRRHPMSQGFDSNCVGVYLYIY